MLNRLMIYWGHLRSSRKTLLISTIGLIFAIAILSSSLLYVDSSKAVIINEIIDTSNSPYAVQLDISTRSSNLSFNQIYNDISKISDNVTQKIGLNFFDKLELFYSMNEVTIPETEYSYNQTLGKYQALLFNRSLIVIQLNDNIIKDLQSFLNDSSSLPQTGIKNVNQGFLMDSFFGPSTDQRLKLIKENNIFNYTQYQNLDIYTGFGGISYPLKVNLTGYTKFISYNIFSNQLNNYIPNTQASKYPTLSKVWQVVQKSYYSSFLFVRNLTAFIEANQPPSNLNLPLSFPGVSVSLDGGYNINYDKFDPFTISSQINQIQALRSNIQDQIYNLNFYKSLDPIYTTTNIKFINYSSLNTVLQTIINIMYEMFLYALPMLIISLLVTNYSFGLIQKKIMAHIGIYKTRGATTYHLLIFQLIDYLIIVFFASLAGMIMGIPITSIVVKSSGLLTFNSNNNYNVIVNFLTILPYLYVILFIAAIIIGFIISARKIIKYSKMTIHESEDPIDKQEPFWKVHYLDVYVFIYGLLSYVLISYFFYYSTDSSLIILAGLVFLVFFTPGPFAIVFGTILLANRIIPIIMEKIGNNLWLKSGGIFAFSFKNIIRHRQSSTRGIILIASLITFLILFFAIPNSQLNYDIRTSQYNLGAEGKLVANGYSGSTLNQTLDTNMNILQQYFSNSLDGFSPYIMFSMYYSLNTGYSITFLLINTTNFLDASSINLFNPGLHNPIKEDMVKLQNNTGNTPVLISNSYSKLTKSGIGDNLTVTNNNALQTYSVVDTFNEWPMTANNQFFQNQFYIIMDISNYNNLVKQGGFGGYFNSGILLKFKNGVHYKLLAQQISLQTSSQVNLAKMSLNDYKSQAKLIFQFRLGQINIDVIVSLLISVTILLMFAYMQMNDRKKELFTERALGMKLNQLSIVFYVESIILLLSGFVVGSIVSIYFLDSLSIFLSGGPTIPRYILIVPLDTIAITYLILFLIASLCSVIPAYYLSKQDLSKSFIVDS